MGICARVKTLCGLKAKQRSFICPGCEWETEIIHSVTVRLQNNMDTNERGEEVMICRDCNKDYRPVTFHRASRFYSEKQYYFNDAIEYDEV